MRRSSAPDHVAAYDEQAARLAAEYERVDRAAYRSTFADLVPPGGGPSRPGRRRRFRTRRRLAFRPRVRGRRGGAVGGHGRPALVGRAAGLRART